MIENVVQTNPNSSLIFFITSDNSTFQSGAPILIKRNGVYEVIGICLQKIIKEIGFGMILTPKLQAWYYSSIEEWKKREKIKIKDKHS